MLAVCHPFLATLVRFRPAQLYADTPHQSLFNYLIEYNENNVRRSCTRERHNTRIEVEICIERAVLYKFQPR